MGPLKHLEELIVKKKKVHLKIDIRTMGHEESVLEKSNDSVHEH